MPTRIVFAVANLIVLEVICALLCTVLLTLRRHSVYIQVSCSLRFMLIIYRCAELVSLRIIFTLCAS